MPTRTGTGASWSSTNHHPTRSANVGLSLGHPTVNTSLSGKFTTASKVAICAMMIRGRHRGLPYAVDRAVLLPGEPEYRGFAGHDAKPVERDAGSTFSRVRRAVSRGSSRGRGEAEQ